VLHSKASLGRLEPHMTLKVTIGGNPDPKITAKTARVGGTIYKSMPEGTIERRSRKIY
jgi:hypothetical protein